MGRRTGPRSGSESSEMAQETASSRTASGASPEPPEKQHGDRGERLGRALRRALARARVSWQAVPFGRALRVLGARWRLGFGVVLAVLLVFLPFVDRHLAGQSAAANGVTSGGLTLSRLARPAVEAALVRHARLLENRPLGVEIAGKRFVIEPSALGFRVNVAASVNQVLAVGREARVEQRWFGYYRRAFFPLDLPLEGELDRQAADRELQARATQAIPDPPFSGGIRVDGSVATASPPRAGRQLFEPFYDGLRRALLASEARDFSPFLKKWPARLPPNAADGAAAEANALLKAPVLLRSSEPLAELTLAAAELGPAL